MTLTKLMLMQKILRNLKRIFCNFLLINMLILNKSILLHNKKIITQNNFNKKIVIGGEVYGIEYKGNFEEKDIRCSGDG